MTEWGNINLVESRAETEMDNNKISLPGVIRGDHSARAYKPEIQVACVRFSPTGRAWSACTTEGLLTYSIDASMMFDPFDLDIEITPRTIRETLQNQDYSIALMQSLKLNELPLIAYVFEKIPRNSIELVVEFLSDTYVDKLMLFIGNQIDKSAHLEFYLAWTKAILYEHGLRIKQRSMAKYDILCNLEKSLIRKFDDLRNM
jgi:periodic tryptophan protein 2